MFRRLLFLDRSVALGLTCLALAVLLVTGPHAAIAEPAWELTGLTGIVYKLNAPTSGALFAWTEWTLHRGDDAGETWRIVPLPPALTGRAYASSRIVIDPVNHTRMFVEGWVTNDDG